MLIRRCVNFFLPGAGIRGVVRSIVYFARSRDKSKASAEAA